MSQILVEKGLTRIFSRMASLKKIRRSFGVIIGKGFCYEIERLVLHTLFFHQT